VRSQDVSVGEDGAMQGGRLGGIWATRSADQTNAPESESPPHDVVAALQGHRQGPQGNRQAGRVVHTRHPYPCLSEVAATTTAPYEAGFDLGYQAGGSAFGTTCLSEWRSREKKRAGGNGPQWESYQKQAQVATGTSRESQALLRFSTALETWRARKHC